MNAKYQTGDSAMPVLISTDTFRTTQEKRVFLLAVRKLFGLPFWERLDQADDLVQEEAVPVGGAVRYVYTSGAITIRGFVSRILRKSQPDDVIPFNVFFSEIRLAGNRQQLEEVRFFQVDMERIQADRLLIEDSILAMMSVILLRSLQPFRYGFAV